MKYLAILACAVAAFAQPAPIEEFAPANVDTLRLSTYITAGEVQSLDLAPEAFNSVVEKLRGLGVTRIFIEVYRGDVTVSPDRLAEVRDAFEAAGFEIYGGIATVPGGDVGIRQEGPLGWFNWQNEKTQRDLAQVMRDAAPVFHHFIVDDFLCTGDVSEESQQAKGERTWSDYRRELMTRVAREVLVEPAKEANPDITMIIKFPQWYDLFHRHGYDVVNMPPIFDEVYIGTETRGARTQRYGFVQPYEGFVNFRWLSAIAGEKTGGAWFDHGDTAEHDFVEQAFQSVIAGANEIVMFHFGAIMQGHPDHARLVEAFPTLVQLADEIDEHPVRGVMAYKPPHSDAHGDTYLMDFLGMLGIPLIPSPTFPSDADVILLPTQAAAAREDLQSMVNAWLGEGKTLIMTQGFLTHRGAREADDTLTFLEMAGLVPGPGSITPLKAEAIGTDGSFTALDRPLDMHSDIHVETAQVILEAKVDENHTTPLLTKNRARGATVYVLNIQTYTQADFDAVNEVLLAPRDLGLLYLPRKFAKPIREAFLAPLGFSLDAPTRVTFQPFGDRFMLYNYNDDEVEVTLMHSEEQSTMTIPARDYRIADIP